MLAVSGSIELSETLALSLVLPAYNEAARLPPYLAAVRKYLDSRYADRYEVLVVDDGSTDRTADMLQQAAREWPRLRATANPKNEGKGAAVRSGVLAARGELVLFADADGATPIEEEARLCAAVHAGADVAIGSRLLADAGTRRSRAWLRGLAGRMFAAVARRMLRLSVRDTQCGFKMFRREVGQRVFSLVREKRFLFDLEVLALAQRLGCKIVEVPIRWTEIPGGHLSLAREFPRVLVQLWRLRRRLDRGE
jgi:dolichyl-phosphate beta-glucosyltransferase